MGKIRVLHADDHLAFSDKLREILEPEVNWVGAVHEVDAVVTTIAELAPDVVLLDISMPGKSGIELAQEIRESMPDARIIMVSVHGEPAYVTEAFRVGASGYVLKSAAASEILTAVLEVYAGRRFVSSSLTRGNPPGAFSIPN